MMMSSSVKHLKLVTGEEVICEVLDETSGSIIVNNAMSLMQNTLKTGEKFFTFKTYMVYQDTPTNVIVIFTDKLMSLAVPAEEMLQQYKTALKEMANYLEENYNEGVEDMHNEEMSLEDFLDDMKKESDLFDSDVTGMVSN
jgi:Sec-independent protein translocase protein TatA